MLTDDPDDRDQAAADLTEDAVYAWLNIHQGLATRADTVEALAGTHGLPLMAAELALAGAHQVWATVYRTVFKHIIAVWIARHLAHNSLTGIAMVRHAQAHGFPISVHAITGPGGTA